jgi:hypothetical protein
MHGEENDACCVCEIVGAEMHQGTKNLQENLLVYFSAADCE